MTDEQVRERLHYRMTTGGLRGYYISFQYTGQGSVDLILAAIADAAKAYHHTEGWSEPCLEPAEGREEYSHADVIQAAAEIAAREMKRLADECLARGEHLATARGLLERAAKALRPTSMLREDIDAFLAPPADGGA